MALVNTLLRSRAVAALTSPHGVDRYLELVNPMWAAHDVRGRLIDRTLEVDVPGAPPVATLTIQPTGNWAGHQAGQHVQLGVEIAGTRTTRVFSVSSAASGRGDQFTITLRANPDGIVSSYLAEEAPLGTILHLSQAQGEFTLPEQMPEHVLMISGGSGITPLMSMLRTLQRRTHRGRVTFLHYAQSPEHQIFRDELAQVATSGYGIDLHLVYPETGGRFFTPMELERLVPGFRDVDTFAVGPAGLIEKVQAAYEGSDKLRVEYFKAPAVSNGSTEGDITFTRTGTSAANSGTTLLEQAEAAGLTPAFGCRMGICFSCTATKKEGTVRNVLTGETSSLPDEDIRICVSTPEGDCAVEL
ncbi:ferredoxin reductase [Nocardioides limicola]|uniref:ferredoxin reductase n=1 Tax=Nocardioides limicola TaxID=2803368 RepID=UPI00193C8568|nr:ferredoxin reductase [Nocardioides sp. DJM-14]